MKFTSDAVDVYERELSRMRAVCQKNVDSLCVRIGPATRAGKATMTKTVGWQIQAGG